MVYSTRFEQISYTEAVKLLEEAVKKVKFEKPVIVYNYPKDIKAFYMKVNDDCKTVAATDVLVPKVRELIGGSQREEHYEVIQQRYDNCCA
ncbi:asparagine--tRNA ligase, cytoplasmic 1-like [Castanea sativa]|uniref:asparagine--tRNA ligase, cytoplasmic 1-like n=1 Tax=Castanea sativa TaxID=21020 RepID=UPI003F651993